jgi:hypothetical protein
VRALEAARVIDGRGKAAAVTGPTLGAVQSRSTVSSLCARCSRRVSIQTSCRSIDTKTARSGAISDFNCPGSASLATRLVKLAAFPLATRKPWRRSRAPMSEM